MTPIDDLPGFIAGHAGPPPGGLSCVWAYALLLRQPVALRQTHAPPSEWDIFTPAASNACSSALSVAGIGFRLPDSKSAIVLTPTRDRFANSSRDISRKARAARH